MRAEICVCARINAEVDATPRTNPHLLISSLCPRDTYDVTADSRGADFLISRLHPRPEGVRRLWQLIEHPARVLRSIVVPVQMLCPPNYVISAGTIRFYEPTPKHMTCPHLPIANVLALLSDDATG